NYFAKNWLNPAEMATKIESEEDMKKYRALLDEMNGSDEMADYAEKKQAVADFEADKTKAGQVYAKDAGNFSGLNTEGNKAGNFAPTTPGHSWIVGVDKASKVDPAKILADLDKARQQAETTPDPAAENNVEQAIKNLLQRVDAAEQSVLDENHL